MMADDLARGDVYVHADTEALARYLGAAPALVRVATARAARKTRNWLLTQLRRRMAAVAGAPQKVVSVRFRRKPGADNATTFNATLWIGTNDLSAEKIARPKQGAAGTQVGRHFFRSAFVADMGYGEKVWKRKGKARFPVTKMTVELDPEMADIAGEYEAVTARKFEELFSHELTFAMGTR